MLVISAWSVVVVVVVACCCCILYRLALMLAPTFAPCVLTFAPYILTFGPCASGVSLLSTGANIPLAQAVVVTSCNLRSWCLFTQPLAQIVHLHTWWYHPLQLALVVLIYIYISSDLGHRCKMDKMAALCVAVACDLNTRRG